MSLIKKAKGPSIAAVEEMFVPAVIHYIFNAGMISQKGFGIPMAKDIAFTLGALLFLAKGFQSSSN